jgi:hypothetical protein
MYQDIGRIMGVVEPIALLAVLLALLSVVRRRPFFIMTLVSFVCLAVMIGLRVLFIRPIHLELGSWAAESIPHNWMLVRNKYYLFTAIRSGFSIIGFCALSLSVLFDTPPYRVKNRV